MHADRTWIAGLAVAAVAFAAVFGVAGLAPAATTTFTVDSAASTPDAAPGDGVCDDGTGRCTLRAAAAEMWPCGGTIVLAVDETITGDVGFAADLTCGPDITLVGRGVDRSTIAGNLWAPGGRLAVADATVLGGVSVSRMPFSTLALDRVRVQGADAFTVWLADSVVSGGSGAGVGGVFVSADRSRIERNAESGVELGDYRGDAGVWLTDSIVRDNGGAGVLGPIVSAVRVVGSQITGNLGDGIRVSGSVTRYSVAVSMRGSTIDDNAGVGLAASLAATVDVDGSTISRNRDGLWVDGHCVKGGAILAVGNSTITQNGSGIVGSGIGGTSSVSQSTVADNATRSLDLSFCPWGTASVTGSILTGGGAACAAVPCDGCGPAEPVTVSASLVGSTGAGCAIGSNVLVGVDPRLGPLADHGGPTPTRSLLAGSPAVDAAGACVGTDQRGAARPQLAACDLGAFESGCGNGAVDLGERCDDGTPGDGDCCTADCRLEPAGASCAGDGEPCTADVCDGAGACAHAFPLAASCHAPLRGGASLVIKDSPADRADKITWKWRGPGGLGEFGDPATDGTLALCVADGEGHLLLSAPFPPPAACAGRPCWRSLASGFGYAGPTRSPGGIHRAALRASASGLASIRMTARGDGLGLGGLPLPLPVIVRLVRTDAPVCWESVLANAARNDPRLFRGTVD